MILRLYLLLLLFIAAIDTANAQGDSVIHIPGGGTFDNVQFARNGTHLLTRENDTVKVWGIPSGKQIGVPIVLLSGRSYAAFLPGDTTVLTVAYGSDSVFNVWDWRTGKHLKSVNLFRPISEAFVTADGQTLAIRVSFPKMQYELWNVVLGTYRGVLLDSGYYALLLDSMGSRGIVKRDLVALRVDVTRYVVESFHLNINYLFRDYFSSDMTRAGFSMTNRPPIIFDAFSGDSVFSLNIRMSDSLDIIKGVRTRVTMGLSDDNRYITTITSRGIDSSRLDVWDGGDGRHIAKVAVDPKLYIATMKISPHNDYVAIYNSISGGMLVWPLRLSPSSVTPVAGVKKNGARWYPNPAISDVTVEWKQDVSGPGKLTILAADGQRVDMVTWKFHESGLYQEHLSTAGWPSGQYFGIIESGGQRWVDAFVVEH